MSPIVYFLWINVVFYVCRTETQQYDEILPADFGNADVAWQSNHQVLAKSQRLQRRSLSATPSSANINAKKLALPTADRDGWINLNVGVLMASHLDSPFDLERCGPAVDLALERVNKDFLQSHRIRLRKVQGRCVRR